MLSDGSLSTSSSSSSTFNTSSLSSEHASVAMYRLLGSRALFPDPSAPSFEGVTVKPSWAVAESARRLLFHPPFVRELDLVCLGGLVELGLNLDARDGGNKTPLIVAARGNHVTAVQLLLQLGATPHHQDSSGRCALLHALSLGHDQASAALARGVAALARDHPNISPRLRLGIVANPTSIGKVMSPQRKVAAAVASDPVLAVVQATRVLTGLTSTGKQQAHDPDSGARSAVAKDYQQRWNSSRGERVADLAAKLLSSQQELWTLAGAPRAKRSKG